MKGEHLQRWRHLAARIAVEQDRETFNQLVNELIEELRIKDERLKSEEKKPKENKAD